MILFRGIDSKRLWGVVLTVAAGCHSAPPPAPPPPPPPPVVEEKPPPPKCEKLEESCVAAPGSKAHLDGSGWMIEPPAQWRYAQGALIMAEANESLLAATVQDHDPKKPERARRDTALAVLVKEMNLQLPKKKLVWPKKPDQVVEAGDYKVSLYQFESILHGDKKGTLLVFSVTPADEDGLLGAGFVPDDDNSNADQSILLAIRSIGKTAGAEGPVGSEAK